MEPEDQGVGLQLELHLLHLQQVSQETTRLIERRGEKEKSPTWVEEKEKLQEDPATNRDCLHCPDSSRTGPREYNDPGRRQQPGLGEQDSEAKLQVKEQQMGHEGGSGGQDTQPGSGAGGRARLLTPIHPTPPEIYLPRVMVDCPGTDSRERSKDQANKGPLVQRA